MHRLLSERIWRDGENKEGSHLNITPYINKSFARETPTETAGLKSKTVRFAFLDRLSIVNKASR